MRSFLCALAATLLVAAPAAAQSDRPRPFALLNFGFQPRSQDFTQAAEFTLYDEIGNFEAGHSLEGAPFFEVGGGVGILRNFSIGASYARRPTKSRDVEVIARVPSPVGTDILRNATASLTGLEHKESAFHIQAIWHVPITVEFELALFGGPTFFTAKHDLVEDVVPTEVGGDFSQVNLTVTKSTQSESAVGFNLGIDGRYMFMRNVGAGATIRYARGSADYVRPTGGEDVKIDMGGLEIAGGLRFRF